MCALWRNWLYHMIIMIISDVMMVSSASDVRFPPWSMSIQNTNIYKHVLLPFHAIIEPDYFVFVHIWYVRAEFTPGKSFIISSYHVLCMIHVSQSKWSQVNSIVLAGNARHDKNTTTTKSYSVKNTRFTKHTYKALLCHCKKMVRAWPNHWPDEKQYIIVHTI